MGSAVVLLGGAALLGAILARLDGVGLELGVVEGVAGAGGGGIDVAREGVAKGLAQLAAAAVFDSCFT